MSSRTVRNAALSGTYLGVVPGTKAHLDAIILKSGDLIRWLYYKETGTDLGPRNTLDRRKELKQRYYSHLWLDDQLPFEHKLKMMEEPNQLQAIEMLRRVKQWAAEWIARGGPSQAQKIRT